jgi:hypothetical protein
MRDTVEGVFTPRVQRLALLRAGVLCLLLHAAAAFSGASSILSAWEDRWGGRATADAQSLSETANALHGYGHTPLIPLQGLASMALTGL